RHRRRGHRRPDAVAAAHAARDAGRVLAVRGRGARAQVGAAVAAAVEARGAPARAPGVAAAPAPARAAGAADLRRQRRARLTRAGSDPPLPIYRVVTRRLAAALPEPARRSSMPGTRTKEGP